LEALLCLCALHFRLKDFRLEEREACCRQHLRYGQTAPLKLMFPDHRLGRCQFQHLFTYLQVEKIQHRLPGKVLESLGKLLESLGKLLEESSALSLPPHHLVPLSRL
jgi:hypothetical protein